MRFTRENIFLRSSNALLPDYVVKHVLLINEETEKWERTISISDVTLFAIL